MISKQNIYWAAGFLLLFIINVLVEAFVLPAFNLDNTPKNDIYFKIWWIVVILWLLTGRIVTKSLIKNKDVPSK